MLQNLASQFVRAELSQRPGARFRLGHVDSTLALLACPAPQVGWAAGSQPAGNVFLEIYCLSPGWRIQLPVSITESSQGLVLTRTMHAGDIIGPDDVKLVPLPDPAMARDVLTDPQQVLGQSLTGGAVAGIWLRDFMVKPPIVVKMNQRVKLVAAGDGFTVDVEGVAVNNGRAGDVITVRMQNGQLIRGIVGADGSVAVSP